MAAILHNWCIMVMTYWQMWYDKGTTVKSLYDEISIGDNFEMLYEIRFTPIFNIGIALIWLGFELLFFIFVIFIQLLRLSVYLIGMFYVYVLSKITKPMYNYIKKIDYPNTFIGKFITFIKTLYNDIKTKILNIRIA